MTALAVQANEKGFKTNFLKKYLTKHMVWKTYGNCLFEEVPVQEVSIREVLVEDMSSGKYQSGKCPVGELSVYQKACVQLLRFWQVVFSNAISKDMVWHNM